MATIKTFAVVRNADGELVAHDASVDVHFSDGIGISLVGLSDIRVRECLLRTITALNASGFVLPGRKVNIAINLGDFRRERTLMSELLDLPVAVALMAERNFATFDTSVRYVGRLCTDGSVAPLDNRVARACRLKWPPNFVSSLTYPDGSERPNPNAVTLVTIMDDHKAMNADNAAEELEKMTVRGTVVSAKVNEVHGVPFIHFTLRTNGTVSPYGQDGESERGARRVSNEVHGILSCVASNEAGGMSIFERMTPGVEVEATGRRKYGRIIVHKIAIL